MRSWRFGVVAMIALIGLWVPAAALEDGDRAATRSVIDRQIEAFRRDDASAAYSLAAPSIRRIFPDEQGFIDMVRRSYRPVYRPRSYEFGDARETGTGLDQAVRIQDEDGADWDAIYSLERQSDGSWQVSGCALVKRPGTSV